MTSEHADWICTKCKWTGDYSQTTGVMYHGVDWQNCPSCNSVAILAAGSTSIIIEDEIKNGEEQRQQLVLSSRNSPRFTSSARKEVLP